MWHPLRAKNIRTNKWAGSGNKSQREEQLSSAPQAAANYLKALAIAALARSALAPGQLNTKKGIKFYNTTGLYNTKILLNTLRKTLDTRKKPCEINGLACMCNDTHPGGRDDILQAGQDPLLQHTTHQQTQRRVQQKF